MLDLYYLNKCTNYESYINETNKTSLWSHCLSYSVFSYGLHFVCSTEVQTESTFSLSRWFALLTPLNSVASALFIALLLFFSLYCMKLTALTYTIHLSLLQTTWLYFAFSFSYWWRLVRRSWGSIWLQFYWSRSYWIKHETKTYVLFKYIFINILPSSG